MNSIDWNRFALTVALATVSACPPAKPEVIGKPPDLIVAFEGVGSELVAGRPLGPGAWTVARNTGTGPAPGTGSGRDGYMIDVVLSTDEVVPQGFATYSASFREDVLLRGGRASNTTDLAAGGSARFSAENDEVPADTPEGHYHLCARIDPGRSVREISEANNLTCIPVRVVGARRTGATPAAHVRTKVTSSPESGLVVDARGRQLLFPIATSVRRFANLEEAASFVRARVGSADVRVTPRLGGSMLAFTYRSRQHGSSYWRDPVRGLIYSVADPVLAVLGGTTGRVEVGGVSLCVDPDGACGGVPSYLTPLVTPTARSHVDECRGGHCTQYHSFFNKVDLGFFKYARHGANTRLTFGPAGEAWRMVPCSEGGPAAAPDERVEAVRVTLATGGDDVRGNSHVVLQLGLPTPFEQSLNGGAGWAGGSVHTVTVPLPGRPLASEISSFGLRFQTGDCLFCTTDNWNLDRLRVELVTAAGPRAFLDRRGSPFLRFTGEMSQWSLDTASTEEGMICGLHVPGVRLEVVGSRLVKFLNEPATWGPPRWVSLPIPGVVGEGLDMVETAYGGVSIGVETSADGTLAPGRAPSFTELESDGICSSHRSSVTASGRTGNGNHLRAEEAGLCP